MAKNNKTRFFYVLYSDKTRVFDQSERAYYPIYIIILYNRLPYQEPVLVTLAASKTREHFIISRGNDGHKSGRGSVEYI